MKDLGLMHYFLELEVWQRLGEIVLAQGKYTIEILSRFNMMDCKSMATPMMANLKKLSDSASDSDLVDPTMYRQLIGSLMYLVNPRLDICFAESTLSQYLVEAKAVSLGCSKACTKIPTWYSRIWFVSGGDVRLQGYTDSDSGGSAINRLSTSRHCFSLVSVTISGPC
jgi:hypothetical protein